MLSASNYESHHPNSKLKIPNSKLRATSEQSTVTSSQSSFETQKIAYEITKKLKGKGIICLYGSLGAGKTTFAKGCGQYLGIPAKAIKSPSFTYIREHRTERAEFYHCDFYRMNEKHYMNDQYNKNEKHYWIKSIFDEIANKKNALIIIEWAEKIQEYLPVPRTEVIFERRGENRRTIKIRKISL